MLLIAALLLGLVTVAMRWVAADVALYNLSSSFKRWSEAREVPSLPVWNETRQELEKALALNRQQAEYWRLGGLLYEWRFFIADSPLSALQQQEFRQRSIDAYRQAAQLRPAWPDGWATLARQKALATEYDAEFTTAFINAERLGRWQPRIQLDLTEAALVDWAALTSDVQAVALRNVEQSLSRRVGLAAQLDLLRTRQALEFFCARVNEEKLHPKARRACTN